MEKTNQVTEVTDISLAAFLLYRGATITPRTMPNGKIAFRMEAENLDSLTDEYFNNPVVPLLDYLQYFKRVKSLIYNMGGIRQRD